MNIHIYVLYLPCLSTLQVKQLFAVPIVNVIRLSLCFISVFVVKIRLNISLNYTFPDHEPLSFEKAGRRVCAHGRSTAMATGGAN